jgi:hypothetical protein
MLPLSLGHIILLKTAKSKFITGEYDLFCDINKIYEALVNDITLIGEYAFAILVCSTTYDDFQEERGSGKIIEAIEQIKNNFKKFSLIKEIHNFAHYLRNGTDIPDYQLKNKNESDISVNPVEPEESIIFTLMTECNWSRNDCYNLPLVESQSAYLLYAHKMETIVLISKEERELRNKIGMK